MGFVNYCIYFGRINYEVKEKGKRIKTSIFIYLFIYIKSILLFQKKNLSLTHLLMTP